jgi:hypothetical protein
VDARFLDVRELRQEEAEVHGIAPSVGLTHSLEASRPGVPAHHAHGPDVLLASFRQRKGRAAYGTTVRVWHGVLLIVATRKAAPGCMGARKRSRELRSRHECHASARNRCVRMTLIKVHGESDYGAHRLPAGKTAAREYSAGVLLVRRKNRSKIDYCYCPRH